MEHTASRHTGPRRWLRAVEWSIAAGLHHRAGATTLAVARDLAGRMDYDTGHARYCLDATAARLGIHPSTVKRHTAVLRELGLLAWVSKGTRTNIRRTLGLPGYAGTATVYAAVIPASYDHAMGNRIIGSGYQARIVVDLQNRPSTTTPSGSCAPPSLTVVKRSGSAEVESGFKDTSRQRASRPTASIPPQKTSGAVAASGKDAGNSKTAGRRSPAQVAQDYWIAAQVRPRVNWTQGESLRCLQFALRPLIDRGLDADTIAAELGSWWLTWRPQRPAAYIRSQLAQQQALEAERAAVVRPEDNAAWQAMCEQQRQQQILADAEAVIAKALRTDADRDTAREYGWQDLAMVAEHYDADPEDAIDLYGDVLCTRAVRLASSSRIAFH